MWTDAVRCSTDAVQCLFSCHHQIATLIVVFPRVSFCSIPSTERTTGGCWLDSCNGTEHWIQKWSTLGVGTQTWPSARATDKKAKIKGQSIIGLSLIYVRNLDTVTVLCQVFGPFASRASLRRPYGMLPNWSYKRRLWSQASVASSSLRRGRVLLNWF